MLIRPLLRKDLAVGPLIIVHLGLLILRLKCLEVSHRVLVLEIYIHQLILFLAMKLLFL
jgi:hypothetical protein